jgi:CheY-like chemotaxis protein
MQLLQESSEDIPLMALTGSNNAEVAVECVKRGASDCLPKDRSRATRASSGAARCERNNCVTKSVPHSPKCEKLPPASDS